MPTRIISTRICVCVMRFLLCFIMTHANPNLTNLRTVRGPHASGSGFYSTPARSVMECASLCPRYDQCDICSYDADDKLCKLYTWNGLSLPNPNNANVSSGSAVMIRNYIRVISTYTGWSGHSGAEQACQAYGGTISTYAQLSDAFYNHGLHVGTCTRVSSGSLYYALQYLVPGTGYPGIHYCSWHNDGPTFCTLPAA